MLIEEKVPQGVATIKLGLMADINIYSNNDIHSISIQLHFNCPLTSLLSLSLRDKRGSNDVSRASSFPFQNVFFRFMKIHIPFRGPFFKAFSVFMLDFARDG